MNGTIRIATIRGIPLSINTSWVIVFVFSSGPSQPRTTQGANPGWTAQTYFAAALITTLLFFAPIVVHELGPALVAARFGIRTQRITLQQELTGITVEHVMTRDFATMRAETTHCHSVRNTVPMSQRRYPGARLLAPSAR